MSTDTHNAPTREWLPLAAKLHALLLSIGEHMVPAEDSELAADLQKLTAVGTKLKVFTHSISDNDTRSDRKIWHDLRNLIGTVIGYCELIQEELPDPDSTQIKQDLIELLDLSHQLLRLDRQTSKKNTPTQPLMASITTGTILIVDDQQESREVLRRYMEQGQHRVLEARDGRQMFEILQQEVIDLILLDQILPEMEGDELLRQLKLDDELRAIPVIIVSGNRDAERIIRCIEAGAEDYLFKPFDQVLLQARISAGIERKRWHDKEQLYRQELELNQTFIRKVFGRYLSEEIVAKLLEDPTGLDMGGEQRKVTVLMADIRGFSSIAEQLSPQRVVRLLNNYLGGMSEIIMQHNGTVDEFIGDAVLAIFGAPISRDNDSDRAIHCALKMQAAMATINQQNLAENLPEISMGVSINTGLVVAGNIGSERRAKYGVVGHAVNQTARIGEHCGPGSILLSEATLKDCQSTLQLGDSFTIQAKGILKTIHVFELIGTTTEHETEQINEQSNPDNQYSPSTN